MRRNRGFSRALGVVIAGCLLVSGFIASPANAAEDVKKSVQSQKIMDERPAVLDENTPSTFSEMPLSSGAKTHSMMRVLNSNTTVLGKRCRNI